jgi:hypothetical protein
VPQPKVELVSDKLGCQFVVRHALAREFLTKLHQDGHTWHLKTMLLGEIVPVRLNYYFLDPSNKDEEYLRSLSTPCTQGWGWYDPRIEYVIKRRGHVIWTSRSKFVLVSGTYDEP